jgi:hypothetical protein
VARPIVARVLSSGNPVLLSEDLAAGSEEGLKDGSALGCENARNGFHLVIESGVRENFKARTDGPALRIVRAVDEARYAGLDNRPGAHATGLKSDVESCAGHAVVIEETSSFADHDDFGVGGRVAVAYRAVG